MAKILREETHELTLRLKFNLSSTTLEDLSLFLETLRENGFHNWSKVSIKTDRSGMDSELTATRTLDTMDTKEI